MKWVRILAAFGHSVFLDSKFPAVALGFLHGILNIVFLVLKWTVFPLRTKTLHCHRQSLGTCSASVLTCHGVQRSTWLFQPPRRATYLNKATFVSGRKYCHCEWLYVLSMHLVYTFVHSMVGSVRPALFKGHVCHSLHMQAFRISWHPPLPGAPRIPRLPYPHWAGITDHRNHRCVCACVWQTDCRQSQQTAWKLAIFLWNMGEHFTIHPVWKLNSESHT